MKDVEKFLLANKVKAQFTFSDGDEKALDLEVEVLEVSPTLSLNERAFEVVARVTKIDGEHAYGEMCFQLDCSTDMHFKTTEKEGGK